MNPRDAYLTGSLAPLTQEQRDEIAGRLWPKVNKTETCWLWTAAGNEHGYGLLGLRKGHRSVPGKAHRIAFMLEVGDIPPGLSLDHLCRVRACVNPSHLEPVTQATNLLRGDTVNARNASRTHCPKGHAYEGWNVVLYRNRRECRTCKRERDRARSKRLRKAAA